VGPLSRAGDWGSCQQDIGGVANRNKHVPWADIVSMRNVVVHHYFGVDMDQIWDAVTNDLPSLKTWAMQMLEDA